MDLQLTDKHALITGGSKGIGLACAKGFLAEGARVTLVSRDRATLEAARTGLLGQFPAARVHIVSADLKDAAAALAAVDDAEKALGPVDVLVNSAGAAKRTPPAELTPAHWRDAMDAKFFTYVNVTDPLVKRMAARGAGAIVNLASYAGLFGGHPSLFYPTSKGAVLNFTRAMAAHHAQDGIRVNAIAPGLVYTPMVYAGGMSEDIREARKNRSLLKVEGTGWDVANGVLYLVSEESRWVTGITLPIDAGASAAPNASPVFAGNR